MIAAGTVGAVIQADVHSLLQHVHIADVAGAVRRQDEGVVLGQALNGILIGVLFIFQAAHQPAAGTGDLGRVQTQVLGLGHLDGHGQELVHELGAAEGPTADAQAADHLGLVSDADLPQLDAGAEHAGQVLDQLAEVHAAVGGKEKQDLAAVKAALHPHQLHLQLVLLDLLFADVEGFLLTAAVVGGGVFVVVGGDAEDGPQGFDHRVIGHLVVARRAVGEFRALGGLHDHVGAGGDREPLGVEVVFLAAAAEADRDHIGHKSSSHFTARAPNIWPTPAFWSHCSAKR